MLETATHHPEKVLSIAQNVARVQERIRQAALRVGRDPASVQLVAASKTVDAARMRAAMAAGVTIFGENYLQEARDKIGQLGQQGASWHLIGTLQRNKVRYIFDLFDMLHSLDSLALAEEINRRGARLGRRMAVLLEVNVGGELTKGGFEPAELLAEAPNLAQLPHLQVQGLMTIPPPTVHPEGARPFYRQLRELRDRLVAQEIDGLTWQELSMGMTADFEVAIEEGATLVRVGTAIFGARPPVAHHG
ncbi:MAG: YggS family pyridoxal phosphate-dependent enzyme [Candidatus Tectomicrobia bacterium]|uniref:Pyridoxal phosphate homeostasis protein n=1 Tax=Tectimicrobiota bacterium TaxID=2528274 RepID=A0A938B4Y6_UNCTE|nr:YggS family pyridoxal phosphate-dependent enzyme [Candidatus Tectomicrobia bacterium]